MADIGAIVKKRLYAAVQISVGKIDDRAHSEHRFTTRTGQLERSIEENVQGATGAVYLNQNVAPYGIYVHAGTRPHVIVPKQKKVLRWPSGGNFVFSKVVHHPGTKPDEFIYQAMENSKADIQKTFDSQIEKACNEIAAELVRR